MFILKILSNSIPPAILSKVKLKDTEKKIFREILEIDSTTGKERELADRMMDLLRSEGIEVDFVPAPRDAYHPANIIAKWGKPDVVYCTHLDTVPPYIPPVFDGDKVRGRGACDAKGQIISMYLACRRLAEAGAEDFALLLLHGEETGSFGAKEFREFPGGSLVIVGEPTDNKMVSAAKGTKSFKVTIKGKSFHSGYPQMGDSAIDRFVDFALMLRNKEFPVDPVLGATTYNIGQLISDNPQNIVSDEVVFRVYFRTTFESDVLVSDFMCSKASDHISVEALGGDMPMRFTTLPGFATSTVSFGSDAPQLTNFKNHILCGPGSILVAHRQEEFISIAEIDKAVGQYIDMYYKYKNINSNSIFQL